MFNLNRQKIDAFIEHLGASFEKAFPDVDTDHQRALQNAALTAMETLLNCDCPYHDIEHTMLVTDVGKTILQGRQLARGDVTQAQWLNAVVAMLFHDVGYLRMLLAGDDETSAIIDSQGERISPPEGSTDAFMTPYHVTRSALYVRERFAQEPLIDVDLVCECIEMTRFPVPQSSAYGDTGSLPGLVRAADLIGQMGDPQYLQKLSRLFAEFIETGEANRLGFSNAGGLRRSFPEFFFNQVHPYIGEGIALLKRTQDGHGWIANLYHHLHVNQDRRDLFPEVRAPELVVHNQ